MRVGARQRTLDPSFVALFSSSLRKHLQGIERRRFGQRNRIQKCCPVLPEFPGQCTAEVAGYFLGDASGCGFQRVLLLPAELRNLRGHAPLPTANHRTAVRPWVASVFLLARACASSIASAASILAAE